MSNQEGSIIASGHSYPVFVLGSPRSATSLIAEALHQVGWSGFSEGHILDTLADLLAVLRQNEKQRIAQGKTDWATDGFAWAQLESGLIDTFTHFMVERHGIRWFDKTPGLRSIQAAPLLLQIFPRARFVFCQRRGLDVVASSARRFGETEDLIKSATTQWVECMLAWRSVAPLLGRQALVIEHRQIVDEGTEMALNLAKFLDLDDDKSQTLAAIFSTARPESTSETFQCLKIGDLGWSEEVKEYFLEHASFCMSIFGYGVDTPFVNSSNTRPILFTKNSSFVDTSKLASKDLYKYLGKNRFLLHPGSDNQLTLVKYTNVYLGDAAYVFARCSLEHSDGSEVVCKIALMQEDNVVSVSEARCEWKQDGIIVVRVPMNVEFADVAVSSRMADELSLNSFAWCNIIDLCLVLNSNNSKELSTSE